MGTPNQGLVLAGTGAGGATGASLLWVGSGTGTAPTPPTDATTVLGTGWLDCGYIDAAGITANYSETVKDIYAYGVEPPVRELTTDSKETFDVTFLEHNTTVLELFYRKTLGSITVTATTGALSTITTGPASVKYFPMVIDVVDGGNHWRQYVPIAQVTDRKGYAIAAGAALTRQCSITAYPDASGNASYIFPVLSVYKTS